MARRKIKKAIEAQETATDESLRWTEEMEVALFETFRQQMNAGKKGDNGWKPEVWPLVIEAVQEVYSGTVAITKKHCQGKEQTFKGHYKDHVWLSKQSGFEYNLDTGMWEGSENAWRDLIKVLLVLLLFTRLIYYNRLAYR